MFYFYIKNIKIKLKIKKLKIKKLKIKKLKNIYNKDILSLVPKISDIFFDILLTVISDKFTILLNFEHVIFLPINLQ